MFNLLQQKSFVLGDTLINTQRLKRELGYLNVSLDQLLEYKVDDTPFEELIKKWPLAVAPEFICRPGEELARAKAILNFFVADSVKDKDVLILYKNTELALACTEAGAKSVWKFADAKDKQFDIIIAYDVFDYSLGVEPSKRVSCNKKYLKDDGKMYVRFHPWCSRSGGRLHHDCNMAWAHLVFNPQELFDIFGFIPDNNVYPVFEPIKEYTEAVKDFKVLHRNIVWEDIEDFFYTDEKIVKRITSHYDSFDGLILPTEHMSVLYVDYILSK